MFRELSPQQRLVLIRFLNGLPPGEFFALVFSLRLPGGFIESDGSSQSKRVETLLSWVEGSTGCGMDVFLRSLYKVAPNAESVINSSSVDEFHLPSDQENSSLREPEKPIWHFEWVDLFVQHPRKTFAGILLLITLSTIFLVTVYLPSPSGDHSGKDDSKDEHFFFRENDLSSIFSSNEITNFSVIENGSETLLVATANKDGYMDIRRISLLGGNHEFNEPLDQWPRKILDNLETQEITSIQYMPRNTKLIFIAYRDKGIGTIRKLSIDTSSSGQESCVPDPEGDSGDYLLAINNDGERFFLVLGSQSDQTPQLSVLKMGGYLPNCKPLVFQSRYLPQPGNGEGIIDIEFIPKSNGSDFVSAHRNGKVYFWRIAGDFIESIIEPWSDSTTSEEIEALDFSPNGTSMAVINSSGSISVLERNETALLEKGKVRAGGCGHTSGDSVHFLDNDHFLSLGGSNEPNKVYDVKKWNIQDFQPGAGDIKPVAIYHVPQKNISEAQFLTNKDDVLLLSAGQNLEDEYLLSILKLLEESSDCTS